MTQLPQAAPGGRRPKEDAADGHVLGTWHRAAVDMGAMVGLPPWFERLGESLDPRTESKKQRNQMECSSFGIQCQGKESFSVGCSYKIMRDKVELLKHLFTQGHVELL